MPIIMTVNPITTNAYALQIYKLGMRRLAARDGFLGVPAEYYIPVEQYAATNYGITVIDSAFSKGYLNEQEYNETISYIV